MAREIGNLKSKQVEKLVRRGQPGTHYDGRGLRLEIKNPKAASWVSRYQLDGVTHYFGIGSAFDFSLAQARDRNSRLVRQKVADGIDPVLMRRTERTAKRADQAAAAKALTFSQATRRYLEQHSGKWESAKHRSQWQNTLATYAEPVIGQCSVAEIDVPLVLQVLEQEVAGGRGYPAGRLWNARPETANRLRGRLESVLDWCKARRYRTGDNPAAWSVISQALPARGGPKHHAALRYQDIPGFMAALRAEPGVVAQALQFLILTAARSQEVRLARWQEIDLDAGVWVVPAERMKMRNEHRVPLAPPVIELLRSLDREARGDGFVFIGVQAGRPLGHTTLATLLKRMGQPVTVHGFRSTFRDWVGETTTFPEDVAEAALAHIKGKTHRAYQRGSLFDRRRELMTAWTGYCCGGEPS